MIRSRRSKVGQFIFFINSNIKKIYGNDINRNIYGIHYSKSNLKFDDPIVDKDNNLLYRIETIYDVLVIYINNREFGIAIRRTYKKK